MDRTTAQPTALDYLYPPLEPFARQMIEREDGHSIYVEQCGNPAGRPVVVVHGGPGGGCSPAMRRFFDPAVYRVILFDQRGCGRSTPQASVVHNTTWHLVADMEAIREVLGITSWMLFGGSWGATLSLVYAITHPERVTALVLRGVFLMEQSELDWFYGGGAGRFFPREWARFSDAIPEEERGDLIGAYHARLFSGIREEEVRFARIWAGWENALASIRPAGPVGEPPGDYARAFSRLENHYFQHAGFLPQDGWIMAQLARITHLPAVIVQGRYDMICPPLAAMRLAGAWPGAELVMVPLAGHAMSEPGIAAELIRATDYLRGRA